MELLGEKPNTRFSPHTNARMSQDVLEPLLRARARELGVDLPMSTRLLSFSQDADGVSAQLRGADGEYSLRASYLIAADGSKSPVREALGIARIGKGALQTVRSVLFRAELPASLRERIEDARKKAVVQFAVEQSDLRGLLGEYPDGRFIFMFSDDVRAGSRNADGDREESARARFNGRDPAQRASKVSRSVARYRLWSPQRSSAPSARVAPY